MSTTTGIAALSSEQLAAWRLFLEAHAGIVEVLEQELRRDEDLPLAWYDVLVQLSENPDRRLRMQELADAVLLSKSGLTRLIDRMEKAGLVSREACDDDRRGTWATLTEDGYRTLQRTAPTHIRGVKQHFVDHLTPDEIDTLRVAFAKIVASTGDTE